ncbi:TPA: FliO/MopB family protein [Salmonella enterica subsp. enterica serovar Muenchen]|nr:FliO/MopB family protein [Salmonella enterica subsp. enterica serovar Muenchen]HEC8860512.1 FliO/MopB family protein [Salmonella enterica subsp. enterica serovar Muenchen]
MTASNSTGLGFDMYPLWVNIGVGFFFVILIMVVLWYLRCAGQSNVLFKNSVLFKVKQSLTLKSGVQLMVIEIDEQWLLLGVTSGNVTCLKTMAKKTETTPDNFLAEKTCGDFKKIVLTIMKDRLNGNKNE